MRALKKARPEIDYSPDSTPWLEQDENRDLTGTPAALSIGKVAREYGISKRALRFYEARGLLRPGRVEKSRRYGAEELGRLALLLRAKRLGFTLTEISRMFAEQTTCGALDISRRQCVEQIRLLERRKRDIEAALAELRRAYSAMYVPLGEPAR